MAADLFNISGTNLIASGTYFNQQTFNCAILCALSGLAIIPVRCDSTGRIGSIF